MRGGDPYEELKQAGIAAIPNRTNGKDKLSMYLDTVIASKNSTGKQVPTKITYNGKTYVYSYTRDMSRAYTLNMYEESNPGLSVTIYIDYGY
jgi:hypothetical protein